jgi:hypothetical protein
MTSDQQHALAKRLRAQADVLLAEADRLDAEPAVVPIDDPLLDVPAVAKRLDLKPAQTYEYCRTGAIPSIKIGKFTRVKTSVLREIEAGKRFLR